MTVWLPSAHDTTSAMPLRLSSMPAMVGNCTTITLQPYDGGAVVVMLTTIALGEVPLRYTVPYCVLVPMMSNAYIAKTSSW